MVMVCACTLFSGDRVAFTVHMPSLEEKIQTHTMTIHTEAKINHEMAPIGFTIDLAERLALRCAAIFKMLRKAVSHSPGNLL